MHVHKCIYMFTYTNIKIRYTYVYIHTCMHITIYGQHTEISNLHKFEQIDIQVSAKILKCFLSSNKSNINQYTCMYIFWYMNMHMYIFECVCTNIVIPSKHIHIYQISTPSAKEALEVMHITKLHISLRPTANFHFDRTSFGSEQEKCLLESRR